MLVNNSNFIRLTTIMFTVSVQKLWGKTNEIIGCSIYWSEGRLGADWFRFQETNFQFVVNQRFDKPCTKGSNVGVHWWSVLKVVQFVIWWRRYWIKCSFGKGVISSKWWIGALLCKSSKTQQNHQIKRHYHYNANVSSGSFRSKKVTQ